MSGAGSFDFRIAAMVDRLSSCPGAFKVCPFLLEHDVFAAALFIAVMH